MSIRQGDNIIAGVNDPKSAHFIGEIVALNCAKDYIPEGCLPCDGQEYSKAQFPALWDNYLAAQTPLLNVCTYTQYAADITNYGQCGNFAVDGVNNTFKTPTIKDGSYLTQAMSNGELGKAYNESLPNIKGTASITPRAAYAGVSGAFYITGTQGASDALQETGANNLTGIDASRSSSTYKDNAKVQGDNIRVRYFTVVADGTINQSQMDWSNWASTLALKAGLADNNVFTGSNTFTSKIQSTSAVIVGGTGGYLETDIKDGYYRTSLVAYNNNSAWSVIRAVVGANQYVTTRCTASADIDSIVTTTGILKQGQGYMKLGNGIILQWGAQTSNGINVITSVSLPTPFTFIGYKVVCIGADYSTAEPGNAYGSFTCGSKTTSSFAFRSERGNVLSWIAIGY